MESSTFGSMRKCKVPVPAGLRDDLREIWDLIRRARRDPDIPLDFDDAIQVERTCGGRCPSDRKRFDLTYYPEGHPHCAWDLRLHKLEIEDIADGVMTEVALWSCSSPDCDCKSSAPMDRCVHCQRRRVPEN